MAKVTMDRETGEVVIRCTVEEAMAVEAVAASFTADDRVDEMAHGVWDGLDDIRQDLMMKHPNMIPLEVREFRERTIDGMMFNFDGES